MSLKRAMLYSTAVLFGLVVTAYVYTHALLQNLAHGAKLSAADHCEDSSAAPKANPNKMLFISCGGFLD